MQNQQQQKHQQQHLFNTRSSLQATSSAAATTTAATTFTNTAKLPIETVKLLIASVSRRPNLWIRTSNGQKRSDINALWQQVGQEVHLPADICRIKWGHLRDNFRKVFIRNTLSAEPPTTWRFYNDMRFMEAAVAENVMRHHRLREQSHYWQELHSAEQRQRSSTSSTTLQENYERSLQNQFNFSEISAFFQNNGPLNKRIKLEAAESETSLQDTMQVTVNAFQNGNAYDRPDNTNERIGDVAKAADEDDDDDDQYDEDAISSIEDNVQISIGNNKDGNYPTSLIDLNGGTKINLENFNQTEKTINTETSTDLREQDSDRMFLLSLLPYLRKVKEQRKLQVRQKLQDVLIQEFG